MTTLLQQEHQHGGGVGPAGIFSMDSGSLVGGGATMDVNVLATSLFQQHQLGGDGLPLFQQSVQPVKWRGRSGAS